MKKFASVYIADYCPYCHKAIRLLTSKGFEIEIVDITQKKEIWELQKLKTSQETVPYVYINDKFIGGCEDLFTLDAQGKL